VEFRDKLSTEGGEPWVEAEHLQQLSGADHRKVRAMLLSDAIQSVPEYALELQAMLTGGWKCELECTYSLGLDYLPNLIERCLYNRDYM